MAKQIPGDWRKVVVYCRVSTEEQALGGHSLDAQEVLGRATARALFPGEQVEVIVDVGTGTNDRRPGYRRLVAMLASGVVAAVLVTDLDRLCRSLEDLLKLVRVLEHHGSRLYAREQGLDTSTAMGRLAIQLVGAMAEFASRQTSERTKRVHQLQALRGKKGPGKRPWGWRVNDQGELVPDQEEQRAINVALGARSRGSSWRETAELLQAAGYATVMGGPWTGEGLRSALAAAVSRRDREEKARRPAAVAGGFAHSVLTAYPGEVETLVAPREEPAGSGSRPGL